MLWIVSWSRRLVFWWKNSTRWVTVGLCGFWAAPVGRPCGVMFVSLALSCKIPIPHPQLGWTPIAWLGACVHHLFFLDCFSFRNGYLGKHHQTLSFVFCSGFSSTKETFSSDGLLWSHHLFERTRHQERWRNLLRIRWSTYIHDSSTEIFSSLFRLECWKSNSCRLFSGHSRGSGEENDGPNQRAHIFVSFPCGD